MVSKSVDPATRLAAQADLRKCLEVAEAIGEIEVIEGADPHLEMGALYELSLQKAIPPILLFRKIKGFPDDYRVAVNVRSSKVLNEGFGLELVQAYRKHRRKNSAPIPHEVVGGGPVLENVLMDNQVDIFAFPAPKWHGNDGGSYIGTECMVIAKDPDSGWVNAGTYRVSVRDKKTLSIFIEPGKHADTIRKKWWARGEHCPMVVTVGQAPALGAAAASTQPENVCEFDTAGGRIGRAIKVVEGRVTGLPFPHDAEIVYEGFVPSPQELSMVEGPFGEWPGYYASSGPEPVLQVKAIYHRNDPIQVAQPPARPIYPGTYFGTAGSALLRAASLWDDLEAAGVPGIKGRMEAAGRRRALHQRDRDRADACRPRQDGRAGGGRLRLQHLSGAHHHHRRRRHRHHQSGRSDVGGGDALGPEDRDRHHRRHLDRLYRPDAAAGAARQRRSHQQPHHHLRGAALCLEGPVPQGQQGRSHLRRRGGAQMGRQGEVSG